MYLLRQKVKKIFFKEQWVKSDCQRELGCCPRGLTPEIVVRTCRGAQTSQVLIICHASVRGIWYLECNLLVLVWRLACSSLADVKMGAMSLSTASFPVTRGPGKFEWACICAIKKGSVRERIKAWVCEKRVYNSSSRLYKKVVTKSGKREARYLASVYTEEMATHSSVLAWRIPGTGEPGGCSLWGHTESDTTEVT